MPEHAAAPEAPEIQRKKSAVSSLVKYTVIALVIVIPVRIFVAEPFVVSGDSMSPTFNDGDYLVVDKLTYDFQKPQRGDVIIFRYPLDPSLYFIKRIVGLPGEVVEVEGGVVTITEHDGTRHIMQGSHLPQGDQGLSPPQPIITTLAPDEYFVLGDDRDASSDSRQWGPLPEKFIVGRALMRLAPFSKIGILPGAEASSTVE